MNELFRMQIKIRSLLPDVSWLVSLQDILREKTNHIEQLMKERETDRDEMSAQTALFNKNISLVMILL